MRMAIVLSYLHFWSPTSLSVQPQRLHVALLPSADATVPERPDARSKRPATHWQHFEERLR